MVSCPFPCHFSFGDDPSAISKWGTENAAINGAFWDLQILGFKYVNTQFRSILVLLILVLSRYFPYQYGGQLYFQTCSYHILAHHSYLGSADRLVSSLWLFTPHYRVLFFCSRIQCAFMSTPVTCIQVNWFSSSCETFRFPTSSSPSPLSDGDVERLVIWDLLISVIILRRWRVQGVVNNCELIDCSYHLRNAWTTNHLRLEDRSLRSLNYRWDI